MSKRVRHQPRFYATLLNDVRHSGFNSKYRQKVKPTVMGVYEVERIVAKRVQGGRAEYFIQWQSYSSSENTWEPAEHLPEELITAFENRSVDPFRNYHDTARCSASALSWFAIRPPWVSVPR